MLYYSYTDTDNLQNIKNVICLTMLFVCMYKWYETDWHLAMHISF
jgi:hypothetical protein